MKSTPALPQAEKVRLEEKQREVRKRREAEQELATQEGREYTGETADNTGKLRN